MGHNWVAQRPSRSECSAAKRRAVITSKGQVHVAHHDVRAGAAIVQVRTQYLALLRTYTGASATPLKKSTAQLAIGPCETTLRCGSRAGGPKHERQGTELETRLPVLRALPCLVDRKPPLQSPFTITAASHLQPVNLHRQNPPTLRIVDLRVQER